MFKFTRLTIQVLMLLNLVVGAILLAVLAYTLVQPAEFANKLAGRMADPRTAMTSMQVGLAMILPVMIAAHLIFQRLLGMIHTAASGEPFLAINGERLRQIGWALLVIQLCDLVFGTAITRFDAALGDQESGWSPSVTGWLAVLLVFVLARIFDQGAQMRDELALTV
jgi:hypothetical protein